MARREERLKEQEAVKTTIVGGRPPGAGKAVGEIPRGIEILIKKASIDPEFKKLFLMKRAEAANEIDLALEPAEVVMINAVPKVQLETIVAKTTVDPKHRKTFLGKAAALMIVALGTSTLNASNGKEPLVVDGIRPARPEFTKQPATGADEEKTEPLMESISEESKAGEIERPTRVPMPRGIRPDRPTAKPGVEPFPAPTSSVNHDSIIKGIRPERPVRKPVPLDIRPDYPERPKEKE